MINSQLLAGTLFLMFAHQVKTAQYPVAVYLLITENFMSPIKDDSFGWYLPNPLSFQHKNIFKSCCMGLLMNNKDCVYYNYSDNQPVSISQYRNLRYHNN